VCPVIFVTRERSYNGTDSDEDNLIDWEAVNTELIFRLYLI